MKPEILSISQISPDQSVICILGSDIIPDILSLGKSETEYARKRLSEKDDYVFINSYFKCTYLVRVKEDLPDFKQKEELRKTAYTLRKLIKSNNHNEIVISANDTFKGAIEAFTEGLALSFYSFRKYKTKEDEKDKKHYPDRLFLFGNIEDTELKWLTELCNAVYLTRDMINEPPNHLNAISVGR